MSSALSEITQGKLPPLLENILKRIVIDDKSAESKQTDIFLALFIVLLSENGFFLMDDNSFVIRSSQLVDDTYFSKWKIAAGGYELTFVMGGFTETLIKLVMCPLGSSCLINVVISDINPQVYSVCLCVNRYVVNPQGSAIPMMLNDLKHLSDTFKNRIVVPVKSTILNYYGYSSASLLGLPEELLVTILLYLPIRDIIHIVKTCKKLNLLLKNESFWHKLFLRDFSNAETTDSQEWSTLYINMYKMHQESLHRARSLRGTMHDLMDVSDYLSYIDNPLWDVIM